ncbi:MAG: hypothetical protein ACLRTA_00955 [Clostridia bacterium]
MNDISQRETIIKVFGVNHLGTVAIEGVAMMNGGKYYYFDYPKLDDFVRWLADRIFHDRAWAEARLFHADVPRCLIL